MAEQTTIEKIKALADMGDFLEGERDLRATMRIIVSLCEADIATDKLLIKALKEELHEIRPKADCYNGVRKALGIEKDILGHFAAKDKLIKDLVTALEAQHEAIDRLFAMAIDKIPGFFPSKSGQPWEALKQGNTALAAAKKETT